MRAGFEAALTALWHGQTEDDEFNGLVLDAELTWRQVVVLRAYARYLRQAGIQFSQNYLQRVLRANPAITRLLVRLFESRFDPALQAGAEERCTAITEELRGALDEVVSLDHDRILRSYLALIEATLRTNYFQEASAGSTAPYLVLKLASERVPVVPAPRPKFEIWVYSPRLEAVHLRFGAVARGGLRWSERPEDFRTEVLGLVKAQEVKNSVIVPSGAKGGFVCKRLPDPADRDAYQAEVLACYRTFISAMLDVTDNIVGDAVVPPPGVVRLDGDDPYLVVAADKGTATFSDVANEIAGRYGYWLGDAFASGGSEGYDHKKMGITARGAWESVRWHFAALRLNPDTDDFTAVGIGDMSGDVFGNGMLLSRHLKLVAAFDHRHVFLDPDPDPAASFAERQRLFDLPRSSWADYDTALISAGGGVWPRSAKSVPVSAQARAALGLDAAVAAAVARRADLGDPARAGRPAVERRHRHLREGVARDARRRGGPVKRRGAGRRLGPAGPGGRRGRQPRAHPGRADRVRARRRPGEHRLHRQLRGRGHLGPRGQHQDPARRGDRGGRDAAGGARHAAARA